MKTFSVVIVIYFLLSFSGIAQTEEIIALQKQLIEMGKDDQKHRPAINDLDDKIASATGEEKEKLLARSNVLQKEQDDIDKKLMQQLEAIITKHGWPTISLVGKDASFYAFLVLQHADPSYQKKYLPLLKEAAAKNDANKSNIATL